MNIINLLKEFASSQRTDKLLVASLTAGGVLLFIIGLLGLKEHSMLAALVLVIDALFFYKIYKIASRKA